MNILSILLPLAGVIFIIATGVIFLYQHFRKNLYRQMAAQEELKAFHQQELLKSSIEVQEKERKRIAQDLHDELGASLSIARMHLVYLEDQAGTTEHEKLMLSLQNVRSLTENALASMRRISHELMPPQLESFGLVKTLESIAARAEGMDRISIQVNARDELPDLHWMAALGLYRIIMELINNTIKHARADRITISLAMDNDMFTLHYHDNGMGLQGSSHLGGLGLKNLEARVSSLKGSFSLEQGQTEGFSASVWIPLA